MIFLQFILLTVVVVLSAMGISRQAEIIENNSKLNSAILGIILAFATSLPEFAIGFTSIFIEQPKLMMGDILGSNVFNCLILAIINIIFYSKVVLANSDRKSRRINVFSIVIYIFLFLTYILTNNRIVLVLFDGLSLSSILIIITYALAIKTTSSIPKEDIEVERVGEKEYKLALVKFILLALTILISSIILTQIANNIVYQTGLEASVVGALFIAVTTSLPEVITCFTLVKLNRFTMATTSIWGSNLFNFAILATVDIFSPQPLVTLLDDNLLKLIFIGLLFVIIQYFQPLLNNKYKLLNILPSVIMIISYVTFLILL